MFASDGLNAGHRKIRRENGELFLDDGSIAQGKKTLDEMFESIATDLCRWWRSTGNAKHTMRKYHAPSTLYAGCRPVDRQPQRLRDPAGASALLLALLWR